MSSVAQSCLTLCDPMDYIAHQAPLSMGFFRQEYWNELPFPSSRDFLDPGIEPTFRALVGRFFITEPPGKPIVFTMVTPQIGITAGTSSISGAGKAGQPHVRK